MRGKPTARRRVRITRRQDCIEQRLEIRPLSECTARRRRQDRLSACRKRDGHQRGSVTKRQITSHAKEPMLYVRGEVSMKAFWCKNIQIRFARGTGGWEKAVVS